MMKKQASITLAFSLLVYISSMVAPLFGQDFNRSVEQDKIGNKVIVYRDPITGVANRIWQKNRNVVAIFDKNLIRSDGTFIGMNSVGTETIESLVPKIIEYYRELLNLNKEVFAKHRIETDGKKWYISYKQVHGGVPVFKSEIGLTIDEFGQIISIGSNAIPHINISTRPSISDSTVKERVIDRLRVLASDSITVRRGPQLVIYPKRSETRIRNYLAYRVEAINETQAIGRQFFMDARSGKIIDEFDLFRYGSLHGSITGKYWPKDINDTQVTEGPEHYHQLKLYNIIGQLVGTDNIDSNGNYNFPNLGSGQYRLTTELKGDFAEIPDRDLTLWLNVSGDTEYNRLFTAQDDGYNLYHHMNVIHDWFKGAPFYYSGMDYAMQARITGSHHPASASGTTMLFGTQGGIIWWSQSDGIYHEYTHNVIFSIYGTMIGNSVLDEASAMDEGIADYFAASLSDDPWRPLVGRNVSTPDRHYDDFNSNPEDSTASPHQNGLILAGAGWDLQKNGGISENDARRLMLVSMQMMLRPRNFTEFLDNIILQDDDDGNLCNTTPHYDAIFDAFETKHGITSSLEIGGLSLTLDGPFGLPEGEQGTWSVDICGGSGSISYQWARIQDGWSNWLNLGTASVQAATLFDDDFQIRCEVTRGTETETVIREITNLGGGGLQKFIVDTDERIPGKFALHQNYPNPFNPETEIHYDLPESGFVKLVITNTLGQHVRTLVSELQAARSYRIMWNGQNQSGERVASGIYLYRISVTSENGGNPFIQTRKMTLLR